MTMNCIETKGLTHCFSGTEKVLNNIDLKVPEGSIYGFLGPNGAGKSTTLKLLLGLIEKQQGEITMFGKSFERYRIESLKKIGSLIESPSIYAHLSATENLQVLQKVYQSPASRIPEVLEMTGLEEAGGKKAGKFSLGMKQRLGIAIALLNHPSVLILDEPTNGLDPNGIIEMRAFLKKLNQEQRITILISSHLLSEVAKLVTHAGIITGGSLRFQGTLEELMQKQEQGAVQAFETSNNLRASAIMQELGFTVTTDGNSILMPAASKDHIARLNVRFAAEDVQIFGMTTIKQDLETIFLDLTKN